MRAATATRPSGPQGRRPLGDLLLAPLAGASAQRRSASVIIIGGASIAILLGMLFFRLPMPVVFVGAVLAGVGGWTLLYPEVGLAALVINALVGLTHLRELPRLGPLSIPIALELILAGAIVVQVMLGRRKVFLDSPLHLLFVVLSFWIVVSFLVNGHVSDENVDEIKNVYFARVLIFFLLTGILAGGRDLKRLVGLFAISNVGLVAASVAARLGYLGEERIYVEAKMLRTQGLVQNPNNLAFDLTTMLILAVFTFFLVKRRWVKALLFMLAFADAAVILSTLSRSGFISLVAVLLFMFFKLTRSARVMALVLLIALAGGLISQTQLMQRFQRMEQVHDVDRVKLAKIGLNAAEANPVFGIGMGNFLRDFDRYNDQDVKRKLPTHNMYMYLASQMGFPSLLLYLLVVAVTWFSMRRMEKALNSRGEGRSFLGLFNLAVQCFLVNLCVFGLSGDVCFEYSVFIMLGFGLLLYREHERAGGGRSVEPGEPLAGGDPLRRGPRVLPERA